MLFDGKKINRSMSDTAANLDAPRWPQDTYLGRLYHFASITNPLNLVRAASDARLNSALQTVKEFRANPRPLSAAELDRLWASKHLIDSTFHRRRWLADGSPNRRKGVPALPNGLVYANQCKCCQTKARCPSLR